MTEPVSDADFVFTPIRRPWATREAQDRRIEAMHPSQRPRPRMNPQRVDALAFAQDLEAGTFDPRGYFVYLLFDDTSEKPFYVGLSSSIFSRLATHTTTYGDRICRVQLIRCETLAEQRATEAHFIHQHQPSENLRGVVPQRRGW